MDQHSVTFSSTTGNLKYHDIICKTPSLEVFDQLKKLSIAEGSAKAVKKNKRQWVDISTKIDADEEAERINAEKATRGAAYYVHHHDKRWKGRFVDGTPEEPLVEELEIRLNWAARAADEREKWCIEERKQREIDKKFLGKIRKAARNAEELSSGIPSAKKPRVQKAVSLPLPEAQDAESVEVVDEAPKKKTGAKKRKTPRPFRA